MSGQEYGLPQQEEQRRGWGFPAYLCFVAVLGLLACVWATQRIAAGYGFHPALGGMIWPEMRLYAPWMCFFWQERLQDSHEIIHWAIIQGQCLFFVPQAVVVFWLLLFGRKPEAQKNLHGSAHWATLPEIRKTGLLSGRGVYVGGWLRVYTGSDGLMRLLRGLSRREQYYLRHDGPEHIMMFAPTRSGKGVGNVIPTLLAWEESSIVLDIKGENWALTSGWRKSQGHKVLRFEPTDVEGTAAAFNPLEEIRLNSAYAITDAQNIAAMIMDPEGQGLKDYWNKAAFAFFAGATLHCMIKTLHAKQRAATMTDLAYMLSDKDLTSRAVFEEMLKATHDLWLTEIFGDALSPRCAVLHDFIASSAREILNKADAELSGVVSTAITNLALYRDPIIAGNISRSDFHLNDLMHDDAPVDLYLVFTPNNIKRLRPLIRLFIDMLLGRMTEKKMQYANGRTKKEYKHRLLLMLDELTSLGKVELLEEALAYIAGYGLIAFIIVQDIIQLEKAYGEKNAIMANCHVRSSYAPNIFETARKLSELAGKTTIVEAKTSLSGSRAGHLNKVNVSMQEVARDLLTPDECMRLPKPKLDDQERVIEPGDMLVFMAGHPPIYGKQILYYLDPVFQQRVAIAPPECSDRLYEIVSPASAVHGVAGDAVPPPPSQESVYEKHLRAQ